MELVWYYITGIYAVANRYANVDSLFVEFVGRRKNNVCWYLNRFWEHLMELSLVCMDADIFLELVDGYVNTAYLHRI